MIIQLEVVFGTREIGSTNDFGQFVLALKETPALCGTPVLHDGNVLVEVHLVLTRAGLRPEGELGRVPLRAA
jgi:uncharacterized metal-binding protein